MATQEKAAPPAKTGPAAPAPPTLAMQAKGIVDLVEARVRQFIQSGQLDMPKNYSVDNAMKSAWLVLQTVEDKDHKKVLTVCTRDSIANSLLDMVVQGLNPGKKQGYFIAYANQLTFQRSYFGSMAVAQMVNPKIGEFAYAVVYEGDKFKYGIQNGKKTVTLHEQDIDNVHKDKIVAAYCIALDKNGDPMKTEIMTFDEIKQAWRQSKMNPFNEDGSVKSSSTHGKFTSEMALKTVINRCCKAIINASSDNTLLLDRINRNEDLSDSAAVAAEIEGHANTGEVMQIEGAVVEDAKVPEHQEEPSADTPQPPVCVCDEMTKDGLKGWDCPLHGRYQSGKFTKDLFGSEPAKNAGKKGPGF